MTTKELDYALEKRSSNKLIAAPSLPYRPQNPAHYNPHIGLIACGGITHTHLKAYKAAGYKVVALCDVVRERAEQRRREFYPKAQVYTDHRALLHRDDVEVVDIAAHPEERLPILREALLARKHILSQKPFVLDLSAGRKLVDLARKQNVKLAINQNGRWCPHFSYIRHAIAAGLIGRPIGVHLSMHWDHNWVANTPFDQIRHLILYDFAVHWFDILTCFMGGKLAKRVYASIAHSPSQQTKQALLGQALVEYDDAQATLAFDGDVKFGTQDRIYIGGTDGSITAYATNGAPVNVTLYTAKGVARPRLNGAWFPDGFHGAMAELLCSIEENREPYNSAENNLHTLALCFAAIASAETGRPQVPGHVKKLAAM